MDGALRITEVFHSLQGESSRVGLPTVFIRLTGCPLRCGYCDTAYAFTGGESRPIDAILEQVATFHTRHVCVTGGEPLAQKNCVTLLSALCDAGYSVSVETSGALDINDVDHRVARIVDIKTPGSGAKKSANMRSPAGTAATNGARSTRSGSSAAPRDSGSHVKPLKPLAARGAASIASRMAASG